MIQEIVVYMIVGAAFGIGIYKMTAKLAKKFRTPKKPDYKIDTGTLHQHNCADCSAECMLRDIVKPGIIQNDELCKKTEIR